jgi:lipoprotein-anchoring transpeptidase ErfK/SrfK
MKSSAFTGHVRFKPSLWLIPLLIGFGFIYFFFATPTVSAAIFASPTPTQENLWAQVSLPKPTYTATVLPLPTDTPLPTAQTQATETPGQMTMQIVDDAAVPTYAPQQQPVSAPPSYGGSKYILVDISEQHMYVYEGDQLVYSFVASTGMHNATRVGTFAVQDKIPSAWGSTWSIWMPDWLGIYWAGSLENGIHALPILPNGQTLWAGFLGRPISYGCVVLGTYDAKLLYDWAEIGTPVEIRW